MIPKIMARLPAAGLDDVLVVAGGIIPEQNIQAVRAMGAAAVFGPGTNTNDIVAFIRNWAATRADAA